MAKDKVVDETKREDGRRPLNAKELKALLKRVTEIALQKKGGVIMVYEAVEKKEKDGIRLDAKGTVKTWGVTRRSVSGLFKKTIDDLGIHPLEILM